MKKLYYIGRYDSRTGRHSYTAWTTGGNYAILFEDGSIDYFGSRYWADGSESIVPLPEWDGEEIPSSAEEIRSEEADRRAKAYLSAVLGHPVLTESEKARIWMELEAIPVLPALGSRMLEFYTRTQAEKELEGFRMTPVVVPYADVRNKFYIRWEVDASSFPGTEHSLYSTDLRHIRFNCGWNAGDHYEVRTLLTPWEETRWGSREAYLAWRKEEAQRIAAEKAARAEREKQFWAKKQAEYEAWKNSPEGQKRAAEKAAREAEAKRMAAAREAEAKRMAAAREAEEAQKKRAYAQTCGKVSRREHVSFEVVLALGPEQNYSELKARIRSFANWLRANEGVEELRPETVCEGVTVERWVPVAPTHREVLHELTCGIARRNSMIEKIIGVLPTGGQKNSSRVADWLYKELSALR